MRLYYLNANLHLLDNKVSFKHLHGFSAQILKTWTYSA